MIRGGCFNLINKMYLSPDEKQAFIEDGFIVKADLLAPAQIEAVKQTLSILVQKYGPDRELARVIPGEPGKIGGGTIIQKHNSSFFIQLEAGEESLVDDPEA